MKKGDTLRHHGILQTYMDGHILDTQEVNLNHSNNIFFILFDYVLSGVKSLITCLINPLIFISYIQRKPVLIQ